MIENYGICLICNQLIEKFPNGWYAGNMCLTDSGHIPTLREEYRSHKFGNDLDAEILYNLSLEGFADESFGEADEYGNFMLFRKYDAVMETDSNGFVTVHYGDNEMDAEDQFYAFQEECDELAYRDEPLYDEYGDDEYAYESGAYESDLWD